MITSETPSKLAEILRDTWPRLYYLKEMKKHDYKHTTTTKDGVV